MSSKHAFSLYQLLPSSVGLLFLAIFVLSVITACGIPDETEYLFVSGIINGQPVLDNLDKPLMVIVVNSKDFETLLTDPENVIIDIVSADKTDLSFRFDLSDKGVAEGDAISLLAFVDVNYTGQTPFPDEGDFLGIYVDEASLSPSHQLKRGENNDLEIPVNRELFSFDAAVSGSVRGDGAGEVTVIAYTGDIVFMDFAEIDFENIIGYKRLDKTTMTLDYTLRLFPFGQNVPIENVYILAFLDKNRNSIPDGGDVIGFHSGQPDGLPTLITIDEGIKENIDIHLQLPVPTPYGYDETHSVNRVCAGHH